MAFSKIQVMAVVLALLFSAQFVHAMDIRSETQTMLTKAETPLMLGEEAGESALEADTQAVLAPMCKRNGNWCRKDSECCSGKCHFSVPNSYCGRRAGL